VPALDGVRRLLVIRHRAGGDLLLTTPALRALRAAIPAASIEVLASRGMGGLLEGNPDVDRVFEFDRRSLSSQAALYVRLLRGGYDCVLDLVSNPRTAWMTALTRARIRVGYDLPGRRYAYTLALPREPLGPDGRPVLRYAPEAALDVVRSLGAPSRGLTLRFEVSESAAATVDRWLNAERVNADRPIVLCLPTGSWPAKTWIPERFVSVMDALAADATPIWLWGPGERAAAIDCRDRMRAPSLLAPETGWQELGALIRRAALWIGNDSGPKHVAVALGVPTVTVFGPTNPKTWHPHEGPHVVVEANGLPCLHCNANRCPLPGDRHMRCMRDVGADRVVAAARSLLRAQGAGTSCASV
jgi:ADP-heptose:LPS heptosyltransferase